MLTLGAARLRAWRLENGFTQVEAAGELEATQSAYSAWEHGQKTPRIRHLVKIQERTGIEATAFGIPDERQGSVSPKQTPKSPKRSPSPPSDVPPSSRRPRGARSTPATRKAKPSKPRKAAA